jgi:putative ABC transport system permease protein
MFNKERWNEILEALNANKFRTLLTAFGVFWGILILIVLLALTQGLRNGVERDFGDYATNSIFMWGQGTSMPYKGLNKGRRVQFKIQDRTTLQEKMPQLKYVSPRNQLGGFQGSNNVTRNEKTGAFNIYGDYPEFIKQQPMEITAGRFISYSDIEEKRKTCVIGKDVVKSLYDKGEEPIGSYIQVNGVNFLVMGIFDMVNSNGDQEEASNTIYIPFTTFSQAFNQGDNVSWFVLTAQDNYNITDMKPEIFATMQKQHIIDPNDKRAIGHFDRAKDFARQTSLFDVVKLVSYVVGFLILISGIIGISNIMLIVVK